ncbi:beta-galactosidase [Opitutaceae bacterium EW11]|nr:beta-galactosidase [Opitutaceae bacterium EW11]
MKRVLCFLFAAVSIGALSAGLARAETGSRAAPVKSGPAIALGSAWYPEQWPEAVWEKDLALMEAAGMNMVRVGEFAWSSLEPEEGRFTLDWLERAIDAAAKHHLVVVLGTPTDAPPAWLTSKYPETLRVDETGRRMQHGSRRQFSYTSAKYRELCRTIVEQLAQRFGHDANVIGWQIGNEYTEDSFDAESIRLFHAWLKEKYGSIEQLNRQWVTAYWSQTYDTWEQIPMSTGRGNPGLMLDYKRFVTDQWRSFQKNQLDVIRRHADRRQFVTTNLGGLGWANRFNRREIAADLDLISWDNYVGSGHIEPYRNGATHDLVRGWRRQNFWVMEIQPGFVDWAGVSNSLDKGETRALVWSAIGHGADGIAFWQWRSALNGQEQYHGAIVGPDGKPLPLYGEVKQLSGDLAKVAQLLSGTKSESEVALLHDYDSRWAIDFNRFSNRYDQLAVLVDYYHALRDRTQSVDIVDPLSPLEGYKLVVAPSLNVVSEATARHLVRYVEQGGHLVLGPRSGMKNEFNALNVQRQPGPLVSALGARVEQFYALLDDAPVSGAWGDGKATVWAEYFSELEPGVLVPLRYGKCNGWLDGQPAAVTRKLGKGTITYLGAALDPALMARIAEQWVRDAGVPDHTLPAPAGVEVCRRVGADRELYVLINHASKSVRVELPEEMQDVLQGGPTRAVELDGRGVGVISRPTRK